MRHLLVTVILGGDYSVPIIATEALKYRFNRAVNGNYLLSRRYARDKLGLVQGEYRPYRYAGGSFILPYYIRFRIL